MSEENAGTDKVEQVVPLDQTVVWVWDVFEEGKCVRVSAGQLSGGLLLCYNKGHMNGETAPWRHWKPLSPGNIVEKDEDMFVIEYLQRVGNRVNCYCVPYENYPDWATDWIQKEIPQSGEVVEPVPCQGCEEANAKVLDLQGQLDLLQNTPIPIEPIMITPNGSSPDSPDVCKLMQFYSVDTLEDLVKVQARHIERLQGKLARQQQVARTPREG